MARKLMDPATSPLDGKSLILEVIQQHPGLTFQDILERLRQTGIDTQAHFNHLRSALAGLVMARNIRRQNDGMTSRFHSLDAAEKEALLAERRAAHEQKKQVREGNVTKVRRRGRPAEQDEAIVVTEPAPEVPAVPEPYMPPNWAEIETQIRLSPKPMTRSALYYHFEERIPFTDINIALEYGLAEGLLLFGTQHSRNVVVHAKRTYNSYALRDFVPTSINAAQLAMAPMEGLPMPHAEEKVTELTGRGVDTESVRAEVRAILAEQAVKATPAALKLMTPIAANRREVDAPRMMLDSDGRVGLAYQGQLVDLSPVHVLKVLAFLEKVKPFLLQSLPSDLDEGLLETLTRPD